MFLAFEIDVLPETLTTRSYVNMLKMFSEYIHTLPFSKPVQKIIISFLSLHNHGSLSLSTAVYLQRLFPTAFQCPSSNIQQNYPWSRVGEASLSARLCSKTPNTGFAIEHKPYAEMWMGDCPVHPAKSLKTGEELHKIVDDDKEGLLGKNVMEKFGGVLPFLPKILSIDKALELQIHPDEGSRRQATCQEC